MSDDDDINAPSPSFTTRVIGRDEMFTIRRIQHPGLRCSGPPVITFRETLAIRFLALDGLFQREGWPPLGKRILVGGEGPNSWAPVPEEWEKQWADQGIDPNTCFTLPDGTRTEIGINFIQWRIETLTRERGLVEEYWAISEAALIRKVLDAPDQDMAIAAAHALGELREKARLHGIHLHNISIGRKQRRKARAASRDGANATKSKADVWRTHARQMAADKWSRGPQRTTSEISGEIHREFQRIGMKSARGSVPSKRSIVRAISDLKPGSRG